MVRTLRWLVLVVAVAGCGVAPPRNGGPAFVDADGDGVITAAELDRVLPPQMATAATLIKACDAAPPADALATTGELRCLERLAAGGGSALTVPDAVGRPLTAPRLGWFTWLLIGFSVLLVTPLFVGKMVRAAGWFFRQWTGGGWFHLASVVQWLIALITGALVSVAVAVVVVVVTGFALQPAGWSAVLIATGRAGVFVSVAILAGAAAKARRLHIESREITGLLASTDLDDHAPPPRPPRPRPRNIVICCDGTGNLARTGQDFGQADSNVAKFYDLLVAQEDCGWRQTRWYRAGVGTGTSRASRWIGVLDKAVGWLKQNAPTTLIGVVGKYRTVMELAFGVGITENILEGYTEIVRQYEPGDQIFLVGFSRGAYTARCIADVIDDIGLLRSEYIRHAPHLVQLYRYRVRTSDHHTVKRWMRHDNAGIAFLGLWDTVAALGVPLWGWSYSLFRLWSNLGMAPTHIACARVIRHALSIDEERSQFFPTLFDETPRPGSPCDVEQRWFKGSHAGVGGGYDDASLSDISLTWMIEQAETHGLKFVNGWRARLHANGLGLVITQLERQRAWRLGGTWPRWHPCSAASQGFGFVDSTVESRAAFAETLRQASAAVTSDELLTLKPGDCATVRVRGDFTWHRTGLVLEQGARYRFTYHGGTWRDRQAPACGPAGQDAKGLDARRWLDFGKRVVKARWMELIGHVAHPRTWEMREFGALALLKHLVWQDPPELTETLIRLGAPLRAIGDSVDLEMQAPSGVFYGFANDWWLAYDKHSGAITLSVQRLADGAADGPIVYVVTEGGGVVRRPSIPGGRGTL